MFSVSPTENFAAGDIAGPANNMVEVAGALAGGPTTVNVFHAQAVGRVIAITGQLGTGCAAGQTVTIDVQIGGVSCLTAPFVIGNADGTNPVAGVVDLAADDLAAHDLVTVIYTEANGGGPTAADLAVTVGWRND